MKPLTEKKDQPVHLIKIDEEETTVDETSAEQQKLTTSEQTTMVDVTVSTENTASAKVSPADSDENGSAESAPSSENIQSAIAQTLNGK